MSNTRQWALLSEEPNTPANENRASTTRHCTTERERPWPTRDQFTLMHRLFDLCQERCKERGEPTRWEFGGHSGGCLSFQLSRSCVCEDLKPTKIMPLSLTQRFFFLNVKNARRIKSLMLVSSTVRFSTASRILSQKGKKRRRKKSLKGVADSLTALTSPVVSSS